MRDLPDSTDTVLALDIGGTKTTAAIGSVEGEILSSVTTPTRAQEGFDVAWSTVSHLAGTVFSSSPRRPSSIAVSIGGPVDAASGMILSPPNLPGWDEIPLADLLKELLDAPVHVEHDAKAGALAEYYFGVARGIRNFVFLTVGTGIGAGAMIDGRLARGNRDNFGEVGHWRLSENGPALYGKPGSWEGTASGAGVAAMATLADPQRWPQGTGADVVFDAARSGDSAALRIVDTFADSLGRGIALIVDLLAPERIVLGSLGVRTSDLILDHVQAVVDSECSVRNLPCPVVPSSLGENLGVLAALAVARAHVSDPLTP
jgi:glucokinase